MNNDFDPLKLITHPLQTNNRWTKHKNGYEIWRKVNKDWDFGISNVVAWGDVAASLFVTPLKHTWLKNVKAVFAKKTLNLDCPQFYNPYCSWVIKELNAVDSRRYPWFYSGLLPKESIGRTDHLVAGASGDISEEMIKSLFFECFQIMMFLRHFFLKTSYFLLPFFFKVQSKIRVHIIHRCALYVVKYNLT